MYDQHPSTNKNILDKELNKLAAVAIKKNFFYLKKITTHKRPVSITKEQILTNTHFAREEKKI